MFSPCAHFLALNTVEVLPVHPAELVVVILEVIDYYYYYLSPVSFYINSLLYIFKPEPGLKRPALLFRPQRHCVCRRHCENPCQNSGWIKKTIFLGSFSQLCGIARIQNPSQNPDWIKNNIFGGLFRSSVALQVSMSKLRSDEKTRFLCVFFSVLWHLRSFSSSSAPPQRCSRTEEARAGPARHPCDVQK